MGSMDVDVILEVNLNWDIRWIDYLYVKSKPLMLLESTLSECLHDLIWLGCVPSFDILKDLQLILVGVQAWETLRPENFELIFLSTSKFRFVGVFCF